MDEVNKRLRRFLLVLISTVCLFSVSGVTDVLNPQSAFMISVQAKTKRQQFNEAYKIVNTITSDKLTKKQKKALAVYKKLAPAMIIAEANKELPKNKIPKKSIYSAQASAASVIGKKLIKKFGKKYVLNKLPKKLYGHFPKFVKKKISFKKFKKYWRDVLLVSAGASIQHRIYTWLIKNHCPKWIANAASYTVGAVVWWYLS